jgi:hypothetical protein
LADSGLSHYREPTRNILQFVCVVEGVIALVLKGCKFPGIAAENSRV